MTNTQSKQPSAIAGRIWKAGMGLFLVVLGSGFAWYLWASYQKAKAMHGWTETQAEVLVSEIRNWKSTEYTIVEFKPVVRYRYEFQGQTFESEQFKVADGPTGNRDRARERIEPYPVGSTVTAWVNPDKPTIAVLKRNTRAGLYSIWFPCLFVIGGLGMLVTSVLPSSCCRKKESNQ
ncbi:MAG: hypothetical protein ACI8UO_001966 [Verrucomicrobiales bacterium]|jgi:hypothetical protein